jgi:lipopolysaccharide export LptBFGC system permease protein LptF
MIVATPLLVVGLVVGLWIRRWSVVAVVTLFGLSVSLSGWLMGWAGDQDTSAAGGAILLAALWAPLALGAALGVYLGRARHDGGRAAQTSGFGFREPGRHSRP